MAKRPHSNAPRPRARKPAPDLGETLEFLRLLWELDHGLNALSKRMRRELGVTGPQRFAVRIIGRFPGISAGELASMLHLDPSTVTGIVRRLETSKRIKRVAASSDRRKSVLTLTPRGQALDEARSRTVEAAIRDALSSVSASEVAAARAVLSRIVAELER